MASRETTVRCWAGRYANRWVLLDADGRVLTEGTVFHCLRRQREYDGG
jgi:hypothetical protein